MCLACRAVVVIIVALASASAFGQTKELWVCADGNDLPFSNVHGQGFENKLAEIVARDLGRKLQYVWWPTSPRFAARVFRNGACDMIMGVPSKGYELADTTQPYYTSTYVFVSKRARHLAFHSFDDPSLKTVKIGLHVVSDGFTPAAQELANRGIVRNVVGYNIFGNLGTENPSANLVQAVEHGEVDVAVAWGPQAGYFAQTSPVPLAVTPICPSAHSNFPVTFSIGMGVHHGDDSLLGLLNQEIRRRQKDIRSLLRSYGVPLVDRASESRSCQ